MHRFTLELQGEGPFYCIWLNNQDDTFGATVAEDIGEYSYGEIMVKALNDGAAS